MNKIEALKAERDGLDVRDAIARYAQTGRRERPNY